MQLRSLKEPVWPLEGECSYFAMCENPATGYIEHLVFGYVPACDRCAGVVGAETVQV